MIQKKLFEKISSFLFGVVIIFNYYSVISIGCIRHYYGEDGQELKKLNNVN